MRLDTVQMRGEHGFTLVELMIAMTLGLLIMAALVTLFVDTSRTNREMAKTNSQIENARFALQLLKEDFVHGGYWGGFVPQFDDLTYEDVPTDTPAAIPDPCTAFALWNAAYFNGVKGMPVQFYNDVPTGCSGVVTNKQANTDVVVVRHADTCELSWNKTGTATADACSNPVTHSGGAWMPGRCNTDGDWMANSCAAYDAGQVYFQPSRCEIELNGTPPKRYVIDTDTTDFDLHARQCTGGSPVTGRAAPIYRFISHIYYIRQCATLKVDGTCADSVPTLVRSEFRVQGGTGEHRAAEPFVEGVQALRVELGVDHISDSNNNIVTTCPASPFSPPYAQTCYRAAVKWADPEDRDSPTNRGDGVPETFVHCGAGCSVDQLNNAAAVRIFVLARANESTPGYTDTKTYTLGGQTLGPFNDGFKRHVFSNSVRFVNVASRRETP